MTRVLECLVLHGNFDTMGYLCCHRALYAIAVAPAYMHFDPRENQFAVAARHVSHSKFNLITFSQHPFRRIRCNFWYKALCTIPGICSNSDGIMLIALDDRQS